MGDAVVKSSRKSRIDAGQSLMLAQCAAVCIAEATRKLDGCANDENWFLFAKRQVARP